jgi:hypothetical protein
VFNSFFEVKIPTSNLMKYIIQYVKWHELNANLKNEKSSGKVFYFQFIKCDKDYARSIWVILYI